MQAMVRIALKAAGYFQLCMFEICDFGKALVFENM